MTETERECVCVSEGHSNGISFSTLFFLINLFLIEVQLIYNVLISTVQQSDSVKSIYTFFLKYSFPLWFIVGY